MFSDLARMKIPNLAVYALVLSYAVLGLIALPFDQYLWHWLHLPVLLLIGIILNACACLLGGFMAHRLARMTPIRNAVPHWESWSTGKRFPMGFPLGMTLVGYLLIIVITR